MEYINVFVQYGGKWDRFNNYNNYSVSGILVPVECTYNKLVEMIAKELNWDPTRDAVTLQYQVNKNMPLMKISNNSSVSFYLELKKKDQDVTKFPLCVDVGQVAHDMEYISVFVHYGGIWDQFNNYNDYSVFGILVPMGCTYNKLVEMITKELNWDPKRDAVTLQYQVDKNIPLMRISNNSSVSFYLEVKKKDQDVTKFPLCVDVAPVSHGNRTETFQDGSLSQVASFEGFNVTQLQLRGRHCSETSPPRLPTIEDMASEICENIPGPEEMNDDTETNVISHPTVDGIAENQIYRSKELLKTSIALYAIQNKFQFKVYRSDRKEYVLKCLDDNCSWSFRASKIGETDMFKIRYIRNSHTCSLDIILGDHRQATSSFVASCIKYKYISARTIYTPGDIMKDMMNTYGVWMSYEKAWRAREHARQSSVVSTGELESMLKDRVVLPSTPKRRSGRPKGKRTQSTEEIEQVTRCGRCGEYGHNRRSCNDPQPSKSKSGRKRKSQGSLTNEDQKKNCSEPICTAVDETRPIL